jgi:lysophospholipase L1-like esterase
MVEKERQQGRIIQDSHLGWMRREARRRALAEKRFVHRAKMETLPAALDSYQETLERIIDNVRRAGAEPIFVAQAMDHNILTEEERKRRWMGAMDGGASYVKEEQMRELLQDYNERMHQTAKTHSVLYIDLSELLKNERGLFIDGHHFNEYGARVTGQRLADALWSAQLKRDVANLRARAAH